MTTSGPAKVGRGIEPGLKRDLFPTYSVHDVHFFRQSPQEEIVQGRGVPCLKPRLLRQPSRSRLGSRRAWTSDPAKEPSPDGEGNS